MRLLALTDIVSNGVKPYCSFINPVQKKNIM